MTANSHHTSSDDDDLTELVSLHYSEPDLSYAIVYSIGILMMASITSLVFFL